MRSAAAHGVLPAAAAELTLTSGTSNWASGSYVEFSSSASSPLSLAGIFTASPSAGEQWEIGVGVGAAASEVEIGSFRFGTATSKLPATHIQIPISGLGGNRVAARHRNQNSSGVGRTVGVKLLTVATEDAALTTTTAYTSAPAAADNVTLTTTGTAWANPAWTQLISSTSGPIALSGIGLTIGASGALEFDVATGAAASEVVLTTFRGYLQGQTHQRQILLPGGVHEIGASVRVTMRIRIDGSSGAGTNTAALLYYGNLVSLTPIQKITQIVMIGGATTEALPPPPRGSAR